MLDQIKGLLVAPIRRSLIPQRKRQHCVYHKVTLTTDCPDGIAAAWCAYRANPRINIIGCIYGDRLPKAIKPGDEVFILDFSFPAPMIRKWVRQGVRVTVLDHHKTSLNDLSSFSKVIQLNSATKVAGLRITQGNPKITINQDESGATLAWQYFFPDTPAPWFLRYVRDRDLWKFQLPQSKEMNEGLSLLRYEAKSAFDVFDELWYAPSAKDAKNIVLEKGIPAYREKLRQIAAAADRAQLETTPPGVARIYRVMVARLQPQEDRLASDVCHELLKRYPNADFVACISSEGKWSLRSDRNGLDFDVEAVAKQYGGGGHRNAAGFTEKIGSEASPFRATFSPR
ncbi:MAG TPA: DHHA1 domain-containing protein [Coleofasciculaceae cyanobacterium]